MWSGQVKLVSTLTRKALKGEAYLAVHMKHLSASPLTNIACMLKHGVLVASHQDVVRVSPMHACLAHPMCNVHKLCHAAMSNQLTAYMTYDWLFSASRAQKTSLWGWALGSVCTVVSECYELSELSKAPSADEGQAAWEIKKAKAQKEINSRMFVLVHALFQASVVMCIQQQFQASYIILCSFMF